MLSKVAVTIQIFLAPKRSKGRLKHTFLAQKRYDRYILATKYRKSL